MDSSKERISKLEAAWRDRLRTIEDQFETPSLASMNVQFAILAATTVLEENLDESNVEEYVARKLEAFQAHCEANYERRGRTTKRKSSRSKTP